MTDFPVVETERLRLRGWREEDFESWAAIVADPETMRFIGGVQSRLDAWRSMAAIISGGRGDAGSKIEAMKSAGIRVSPNPAALGTTLAELLKG